MAQALADLAAANGAQGDALQAGLDAMDPAAMQAWQEALEQALQNGSLSQQQFAELSEQGWRPRVSLLPAASPRR